jgi:ferritin-like metal-binding protein YciE
LPGKGNQILPKRLLLDQANRRLPVKTLAELFEHTLQDVYYAENALTKALPKVAKAVGDAKLKQAVEGHLKQTRGHVQTLKKVFASLNVPARGEKCDAIEGLIKETDGIIKEASGKALNAGLLAAAQSVEHYEISRYGTLVAWAEKMQMGEAAELLQETLDEEKATDEALTELAESEINVEAEETNDEAEEERPKRRAGGRR